MAGLNKKLFVAAEAYFAELRRVHASGGGTGERSYYPALAGLLGAVGATLKPKVLLCAGGGRSGCWPPDTCPLHGEAGSEGSATGGTSS